MDSSFWKKIGIGFVVLAILGAGIYLLQNKVFFKKTQVNYKASPYPSIKLPPKPPENLRVAVEKIEVYLEPNGKKVGYFVPGQQFWLTGETKDGFIKVKPKGAARATAAHFPAKATAPRRSRSCQPPGTTTWGGQVIQPA